MKTTRREILALGAGAFLVATFPFPRGRRLARRTVPVMGTLFEVAVACDDPRRAQAAIEAALAEVHLVDRTMSRFRADSEVGVANREAARAAVPVGPATRLVLGEALAWAEATDGAFDPCLGRAIGLWDVNRRKEPPPGEEIRALAGRRLFERLDLRRASVRFAEGDVAIDLGAIGKGFAVDRAVDALRRAGIRDAIVNLGGDLYAMGESEDGDPWRIGVRSASDPSRCDRVLEVRDEAVATSGDYLQGFLCGGVRYHHLLDPRTGAPVRAPRHSLSIAAPTCMAADAAATAVFGKPRVDAEGILRSRGAHIVDEEASCG